MTVLLFVVAAAAGAVLRHLVATGTGRARRGVVAVNVAGGFLLGLLVARGATGTVLVVLGTGFCGALTTWSTFAHDVATEPDRRVAAAHVVVSLVLGLGAAAAGLALG